ncbi:MAG: ABC transporter ATP-binding protein [Deltaproteobacteria bacterium]
MEEKIIIAEHLSKTFPRVVAVDDLSFEVGAQTCFGFLGPNGAGKSTLMKIIYAKCLRDENKDSRLSIFGYDPKDQELAIKYCAGVVPQDDNLDEELNVIQNLMIYSKFYNIPARIAKERIARLLDFLELTEKANARITEISGGMKRRLVIARALLNNPRLLILDEPTTGLDPQVRHLIWDKLRLLKKEGTTILLTTHYMEEAFQICDTVMIMHKGQRIIEGPPRQLLKKNIERFVLELFDVGSLQDKLDEALRNQVRIDRSQQVTLLFSNNLDYLKVLAGSMERGNYYLRETNLEDVFLKATGRGLNESQ